MADSGPQPKQENKTGKANDYAQEFSISRFNLFRRLLAVVLTVLLCFSLFMSEMSRFNHGQPLDLISKMTPIYILLIVFSMLMAVKAILSVKQIKVSQTGIEISNLFWQENRAWTELKTLQAPKNLNFAWLRTKNSVYLFAKRDFENYAELEALIGHYLTIEG